MICRAVNSKAVSETANNEILPALASSESSKAENGVSCVNESRFGALSWKMMAKEKCSVGHTPNFKKDVE